MQETTGPTFEPLATDAHLLQPIIERSTRDPNRAVAAYRAAQVKCGALRPARRARAACGEALLGEAEVLEHAGRTQPAIQTYLAIPPRAGDDQATAATAVYRAGLLLLGDHQVAPSFIDFFVLVHGDGLVIARRKSWRL